MSERANEVSKLASERANKLERERKLSDRRRVSEKAIERKRWKNRVEQLAKWKPKKKNDKNIDRIQ